MDATDPAVLSTIKSLLRAEGEHNEKKADELREHIKNKAQNVRREIARRKLLKTEIAKSENHLRTINFANDKMRQTISLLKQELEIAETGQDTRTRISTMRLQEYKNVLKKFEDTWAEYEAEYEQFPLAQVRKQTRTDLENGQVEKEYLEKKISEKKRRRLEMSRENWEKVRAMIVELARSCVDQQMDCKTVEKSETECELLRIEIESLESELKTLQEREAEFNAKREEKIDFPSILDSLFLKPAEPARSYRKKTQKAQKLPRTISDDSLTSLDSGILEKMCKNAEEILKNTDNAFCGDAGTTMTRIHNGREGAEQVVPEQQENRAAGREKQAGSQMKPAPVKQEISKPNKKELNESRVTKVNTAGQENMPAKTTPGKQQQPRVICVEKQAIKVRLMNSGQANMDQGNITEQEAMDLDNDSPTTRNVNIVREEGEKAQVTANTKTGEVSAKDAPPEFLPDESKRNPEKDKSSVVSDQSIIDDAMEIAIESNSIASSQNEIMEQTRKSNELEIDGVSMVSTTLQDTNDIIPNVDSESRANSLSTHDSIMNLKMSDCSFISRCGDDNAVDNSSTCNDCITKEDKGNEDADKDGVPAEFNFGMNFNNLQGSNFQLF